MKWQKYKISTTTVAEDFISAMLSELGINGIEIEDKVPLSKEDQSDMFIDFPPELGEDDGKSNISFYLENNDDELLKKVREGLEELKDFIDIGVGTIDISETEDVDWINNWKNFFHSFTIDNILIKPTWEDVEEADKDKILIEIDPGISFGTGKHETTQLCIKGLGKYLDPKKENKVLDVGFGSGILSIVALKLGAAKVVGTDLDVNCIESVKDNLKVNNLSDKDTKFYVGNLIDDAKLQDEVGEEEYDIVVANILADVIIPMAPVIPRFMKKGGYFITSGIIDFKEDEVRKAIEAAGLEVLEINHQGEWVNITARKN